MSPGLTRAANGSAIGRMSSVSAGSLTFHARWCPQIPAFMVPFRANRSTFCFCRLTSPKSTGRAYSSLRYACGKPARRQIRTSGATSRCMKRANPTAMFCADFVVREVKFGALVDKIAPTSAWLATGVYIASRSRRHRLLTRRPFAPPRPLRPQRLVCAPHPPSPTAALARPEQRPNLLPLRRARILPRARPLPARRAHEARGPRARGPPRSAHRRTRGKHGHLLRGRETPLLRLSLYAALLCLP